MSSSPTLVWFRKDLRLNDNPALTAALERGQPVVPVYIHAPDEADPWAPGGATRWWLHRALQDLRAALAERGLPLVFRQGPSAQALTDLVRETGADTVYWNRRYEPALIKRDSQLKTSLGDQGLRVRSFNGSLLWEPHTVANKQGLPFRVFTPFWRHLQSLPVAAPVQLPETGWRAPEQRVASDPLEAFELQPRPRWDQGLETRWDPSLSGASAALEAFLTGPVNRYGTDRDLPGKRGTSRLSPYLASGQLSPRQVWATAHAAGLASSKDAFKFLSEIGWREFAYHLLVHFPHTPEQSLGDAYRHFPWQEDPALLRAWQRGETGYPIVDAGMRELWHTGWMHNRVRMIVGSLLVKHLLQPWQAGARWFWDTLVDADLASNTMGWQWSAGCGADAAPYFRIFNPTLQGQKFDAKGQYVRRWVPELAGLPDKHLHTPWETPPVLLQSAGIVLGKDYPKPVVDHKAGRQRALDALALNKQRNAERERAL